MTSGYRQGRYEGRNNSPGAESLRGRQITAGGAEKSQQCHMYILQCSKFACERSQVRTRGRRTCFLPRAPSNLVTHLDVERTFHAVGDSTTENLGSVKTHA